MKVYPVGLVGESHYQHAIARSHPGEAARICIERGNPHDKFALLVENNVGETIGYIPRDSWLHRAIHEEGRGTAATIKAIERRDDAPWGVVLDVTLTDDLVPARSYPKQVRRTLKSHPLDTEEIDQVNTVLNLLNQSATVPIFCDCGEKFGHPIAGLDENTPLICPHCGKVDQIDQQTVEHLAGEYLSTAKLMLKQNRWRLPGDDYILQYRMRQKGA